MTIERAALCVAEIDKASLEAGKPIAGWFSTYDNVDRMGRIMKAGAFGSTLGGQAHGGRSFASFKVPLLAYHADDKPVGVSAMEPQKSYGGRHSSQLAATDFARDMAALIAAGAVPATSIGWDTASAVWTVNASGHREYTYTDIMENSFCPCPANPLAILDAASLSATGAMPAWEKDLPEWMKDLWPDFARMSLQPQEVIRVASAPVEMAAGAQHSRSDQDAIQSAHDSLVMAGAKCDDGSADYDGREVAAAWDRAFINDLPDSAFAVVQDGGKKDEDGKTVPRSLRRLPYKGSDGKVDKPHLRNALARVDQTKGLSDEEKAKAKRVLTAAAKDAGIDQEESAALIHSGRERAAVQGSFEETQDMLRQALNAAYPAMYPYIRATYGDNVVYELDGGIMGTAPGAPEPGTYRVSYALDDDGDVEFGTPEAVRLQEQVTPLPADDDDDRLVAGVDALELDVLELEVAGLG